MNVAKPAAYRGILWGGLIAGILDISAAFINSTRSPIVILQSIASGLLGKDSYQGGFKSAALGLMVHFLVAFVAAAVFYAASRKLRFLVTHAIVWGLLYGIAVYLFMFLVVLPLRFHRSFVGPPSAVITGVLIHMLCVGLPISIAVRRYSR